MTPYFYYDEPSVLLPTVMSGTSAELCFGDLVQRGILTAALQTVAAAARSQTQLQSDEMFTPHIVDLPRARASPPRFGLIKVAWARTGSSLPKKYVSAH